MSRLLGRLRAWWCGFRGGHRLDNIHITRSVVEGRRRFIVSATCIRCRSIVYAACDYAPDGADEVSKRLEQAAFDALLRTGRLA